MLFLYKSKCQLNVNKFYFAFELKDILLFYNFHNLCEIIKSLVIYNYIFSKIQKPFCCPIIKLKVENI